MQEYEELSSGKAISRHFDDKGRVTRESHAYGMLDIGIQMDFDGGVKTAELYFVKRNLVSQKRYEKARLEYADMPSADTEIEDIGGGLLKHVKAERQQRAKAAKEHTPDPETAAHIDSCCESILATGKRADAESWIECKDHTLGEYSHAQSRNLIKKLMRAGAKRVHVCDIDCYDDDQENTGHLVVELPEDPKSRQPLFREVDRLGSAQGFHADFDDGQRYAYVKLD